MNGTVFGSASEGTSQVEKLRGVLLLSLFFFFKWRKVVPFKESQLVRRETEEDEEEGEETGQKDNYWTKNRRRRRNWNCFLLNDSSWYFMVPGGPD